MKRYRKEFKQVWERAAQNIGRGFNRILSKVGETAGDEGQTYRYRQVMEVCKFDKKGRLKEALVFCVETRFNVTDVTHQVKIVEGKIVRDYK